LWCRQLFDAVDNLGIADGGDGSAGFVGDINGVGAIGGVANGN